MLAVGRDALALAVVMGRVGCCERDGGEGCCRWLVGTLG